MNKKLSKILINKEKVEDLIYGLSLLVKQQKIDATEFSKLLEDTKHLSLTNDNLKALSDVLEIIKNNTENTDEKPIKTTIVDLPKILNVKVTNLTPDKQIQEVSMAKPYWWQEIDLSVITNAITKAFNKILNVKVSNVEAKDAIPVKLVHNSKFYQAMFSAISGSVSAFKENGASVECELVNGKVQVDVISMPDIDVLENFNTNNIKTIGAVTYIGMEDKTGVYLIKKIDTTTDNVFTYATITNNPTVLTYTAAWAGILTNTYSIYSLAF